MQVFGLPGEIIRNGRAASRLLAAKPLDAEAERRRDAVWRWRRAMSDGLSAERAGQAVGVSRSTLYRWERDAEEPAAAPRSAQDLDARAQAGGRTAAPGLSDVGASQATAHAAEFLADMPFPAKAIQVDGGSEFMAEFDTARQAKGIVLDGGANLSGPPGSDRILRGGSWSHNPAMCRSAYRDRIAPDNPGWRGRISLRVVCILSLNQLKLPVKVVVFNNGSLGFVELEQKSTGFLPTGIGDPFVFLNHSVSHVAEPGQPRLAGPAARGPAPASDDFVETPRA